MTVASDFPLVRRGDDKHDSPPAKSVKDFFSYNAKYFL
jgi:hypothetical protein